MARIFSPISRRTLLGSAALLTASPVFGVGREVIARSRQGLLRGALENGVAAFKGIAYAGETMRFMAPAPLSPWTGVRDALAFGASSAQQGLPGMGGGSGSEQCQFLNVWTPATDEGSRPVMVWLHGGGYQYGSASLPQYDGANLARDENIVLVSVNHRLGAFGQLWLKHLDDRFADAGVAGFLDIVAALSWVSENIAAFGGDPNRVTIFGQSGGGGKVLSLMGMPAAAPLFHSAICQSGSQERTTMTAEEAAVQTDLLINAAGLRAGDVDGLVNMSTTALIEAQAVLSAQSPPHPVHPRMPGATGTRPYSAVIDGVQMPEEPFGKRAPAFTAHIPLMIGSTSQELRAFAQEQPELFTLDEEGLKAILERSLGARAAGTIDAYKQAQPTRSPSDLYWAISADELYWRHSIRLAELKSKDEGAPVYMYRYVFDPELGRAGPTPGAGHGQENALIFKNLSASQLMDSTTRLVSSQMSGSWASFATNGVPSHSSLPEWAAFELENRTTMLFNSHSETVNNPSAIERVWWKNHALS